VTAEQRGPGWVIRIEDNGRGVAPKDQARVFMPFKRLANRDVPGTGLGLAVCKKIVEGLGGNDLGRIRARGRINFLFYDRGSGGDHPGSHVLSRRCCLNGWPTHSMDGGKATPHSVGKCRAQP
jgi:hypothetical protein